VEAAFFDLDKTVIARASMVAFGRPLYQAGLVSRWLLLRALWGQLVYLYLGADEDRMARMRESALRHTRGWHKTTVSKLVKDSLEQVIEPIIYEEALALIREHRDAGRKVFIVSASPEEVVAPLTTYLGADEAIATQAGVDDQGRYTGDVEFYSYGPFKAEAMRRVAERDGIDLSASWAYSDSATDIPMLDVVGHPVAVNPDRALARYAEREGWEVKYFVRKVPLRERVPMPPAGPTVAVGGGLAAAVAAAVVVVWWLRREERRSTRRQRAWRAARRQAAVIRLRAASWRPPRPGR